jgi:hypothetical protein
MIEVLAHFIPTLNPGLNAFAMERNKNLLKRLSRNAQVAFLNRFTNVCWDIQKK